MGMGKIKLNEVREGNVFSYHSNMGYEGDIKHKVLLLSIHGGEDMFNNHHCPYKIDPTWLVRMGFIKSVGWYYKIDDEKSFEVSYNNDTNENQWYLFFRNFNGDKRKKTDDLVVVRRDLKYVHELQNVFFWMTGKEIEVSGDFLQLKHNELDISIK